MTADQLLRNLPTAAAPVATALQHRHCAMSRAVEIGESD